MKMEQTVFQNVGM